MDKQYEGEGYGILCPSCGQIYHETTEHFSGSRASNGRMFRLRKQYGASGENWLSFTADEAVRDADLECPGCGNPYTQGTKVRVVPLESLVGFEVQEDAEIASLEAGDKFVEAVEAITAPEPAPVETPATDRLKNRAATIKVGGKK